MRDLLDLLKVQTQGGCQDDLPSSWISLVSKVLREEQIVFVVQREGPWRRK